MITTILENLTEVVAIAFGLVMATVRLYPIARTSLRRTRRRIIKKRWNRQIAATPVGEPLPPIPAGFNKFGRPLYRLRTKQPVSARPPAVPPGVFDSLGRKVARLP